MPKFAPKTKVQWESQAGGSSRLKVGEIIMFIPKGVHIAKLYPDISSISRAQNRISNTCSSRDRYLVLVPKIGKSGNTLLPMYYAPYETSLEVIVEQRIETEDIQIKTKHDWYLGLNQQFKELP